MRNISGLVVTLLWFLYQIQSLNFSLINLKVFIIKNQKLPLSSIIVIYRKREFLAVDHNKPPKTFAAMETFPL